MYLIGDVLDLNTRHGAIVAPVAPEYKSSQIDYTDASAAGWARVRREGRAKLSSAKSVGPYLAITSCCAFGDR